MNRKIIKTKNSISIEKFLKFYYHLDNEVIIEILSALSHKELKKVCREIYDMDLWTLPFDTITEEEIGMGEIILVADRFNNIAPYRNPNHTLHDLFEYNPKSSFTVDQSFDYDDYLDIIEDNLTVEDVDVSKIGSFNKTHKKRR